MSLLFLNVLSRIVYSALDSCHLNSDVINKKKESVNKKRKNKEDSSVKNKKLKYKNVLDKYEYSCNKELPINDDKFIKMKNTTIFEESIKDTISNARYADYYTPNSPFHDNCLLPSFNASFQSRNINHIEFSKSLKESTCVTHDSYYNMTTTHSTHIKYDCNDGKIQNDTYIWGDDIFQNFESNKLLYNNIYNHQDRIKVNILEEIHYSNEDAEFNSFNANNFNDCIPDNRETYMPNILQENDNAIHFNKTKFFDYPENHKEKNLEKNYTLQQNNLYMPMTQTSEENSMYTKYNHAYNLKKSDVTENYNKNNHYPVSNQQQENIIDYKNEQHCNQKNVFKMDECHTSKFKIYKDEMYKQIASNTISDQKTMHYSNEMKLKTTKNTFQNHYNIMNETEDNHDLDLYNLNICNSNYLSCKKNEQIETQVSNNYTRTENNYFNINCKYSDTYNNQSNYKASQLYTKNNLQVKKNVFDMQENYSGKHQTTLNKNCCESVSNFETVAVVKEPENDVLNFSFQSNNANEIYKKENQSLEENSKSNKDLYYLQNIDESLSSNTNNLKSTHENSEYNHNSNKISIIRENIKLYSNYCDLHSILMKFFEHFLNKRNIIICKQCVAKYDLISNFSAHVNCKYQHPILSTNSEYDIFETYFEIQISSENGYFIKLRNNYNNIEKLTEYIFDYDSIDFSDYINVNNAKFIKFMKVLNFVKGADKTSIKTFLYGIVNLLENKLLLNKPNETNYDFNMKKSIKTTNDILTVTLINISKLLIELNDRLVYNFYNYRYILDLKIYFTYVPNALASLSELYNIENIFLINSHEFIRFFEIMIILGNLNSFRKKKLGNELIKLDEFVKKYKCNQYLKNYEEKKSKVEIFINNFYKNTSDNKIIHFKLNSIFASTILEANFKIEMFNKMYIILLSRSLEHKNTVLVTEIFKDIKEIIDLIYKNPDNFFKELTLIYKKLCIKYVFDSKIKCLRFLNRYFMKELRLEYKTITNFLGRSIMRNLKCKMSVAHITVRNILNVYSLWMFFIDTSMEYMIEFLINHLF